jgi:signal transduction histidine kinase/ligand-binding sensor domain-containing protein
MWRWFLRGPDFGSCGLYLIPGLFDPGLSNLGWNMTKRAPQSTSGVARRDVPKSRCVESVVRSWLKAVLLNLSLLSAAMHGERRATRVYTIADGLPSRMVYCTVRDSHGFMWFCTREGLSRFDGYTFANYGEEQGLPDRVVTSFLETKHGEYWVGTGRGVALFDPKPSTIHGSKFTPYGTNDIGLVSALQEDVVGTVWVAASNGLFQFVQAKGSWLLRRTDVQPDPDAQAEGFLADHAGNLWITIYRQQGQCELWRVSKDGDLNVLTDSFLANGNRIGNITEDRQGRIWLGTYKGLALLVAQPRPGSSLIEHVYSSHRNSGTFLASDGRLWLGGKGTSQILTDSRGRISFHLVDPDGFGFTGEDEQGNLWWANQKIEKSGFISYGTEDGLRTKDIRSIFQGVDGSIYFVTGLHNRYIHRFDGHHFTAVSPHVPGHNADWDWGGWGWGQTHFQDHLGEWWIATSQGVLRYPRVERLEDLAHTSPTAFYPKHDIFRMYEDSRGDVWIGAWGDSARWERSSGRLVPFRFQAVPTAFREDRGGNMWIGYWGGGLSRQYEGQQDVIIPYEGSRTGTIFSLFLDHAGRMWAGTTRGGLLRFDNPTERHPVFRVYSTREGLSSNEVRAITEDHFGQIYFWTGRGIDRLNPDSGAIRHYTEGDGLAATGADSNVAFCDRQGRLWFGYDGLSRLDPEPDRPPQPPPIRITRLKIRGVDYPVSELGETKLSGLELQPYDNEIQIEYASLNFAAGDVIRYQYKFDGVDPDWSPATDSRSVNFPRLPSGRYRFLVRAVNADGLVSVTPAAISMRMLPPVWARWWFVTTTLAAIACAAFLAYRYRVRHLLELERVRTRIATDLHDDIGSSLTQIAIMSEVAQKHSDRQSAAEPLSHIADLSRELVDSMSDIVWAINPKRDHLLDLTQRMRRFANDVLEAADISVVFHAPQQASDIELSADLRREVFLVFKESVNNIVKHADCRHVEVRVDLRSHELRVELRDDGRGFPVQESDNHGHGLASMRERAARLGGHLEVESESDKGTTLRLIVPLGRSTVRQFTFGRG